MACFDRKELAEFIRHEFIVDGDNDGQCMKILQPPSRRAKPGGLPLNFRSAADSDTNSEEHSPCYSATSDCDESTYELIQKRLCSRMLEADLSGTDDEDKVIESNVIDSRPSVVSDTDFFQHKDMSSIPSPLLVKKSVTALFLERTDFTIRPDLAAYARFAAQDAESGRKLLVFYPFAELAADKDKQSSFSLTVYARCEIRISDLIGLCCYEYARSRRTNDIGTVAQYHLLMAEESGEVDRDLPAVDGHRLLNELGPCWSTVALVKRHPITNSNFETTNIIVHTVRGGRYEFVLDSLDVPLRWLRDQAVRKRIEDEGEEFISDCLELQEYILETVKQRDVVLDLDVPISSTACSEFLLLRINSSRGDFTPMRYSNSGERVSTLNSQEQLQCPVNTVADTTKSSSPLDISGLSDNSVVVYLVERIRRYKSKSSASLIIRSDGFELAPAFLDQTRKRNSLFVQSPLKTLSLKWDYVGGVEITDRSNSAKRVIRIVWLADPTTGYHWGVSKTSEPATIRRASILSTDSEESVPTVRSSKRKLFSDACWKILQLEADVDDAWAVAEKMSSVIDNRNSEVRQIYKYSNGGSRKPKEAAAEFLSCMAAGTSLKGRIIPASPMARKVSRITSTVASAVPTLQKLLSKHD